MASTKAFLAKTVSNERYYSIQASGPRLDNVFTLRYKSYLDGNYIEESESKRFFDQYDSQENCISYLTYLNQKIIGSIRCCYFKSASSQSIPLMDHFSSLIENKLGKGNSYLEVNKLVVDPVFQNKKGILARFNIYANVIEVVDGTGVDYVLVAVRPEHVRFYKKMFYESISDVTSYPGLKFPVIIMACKRKYFEMARSYIADKVARN